MDKSHLPNQLYVTTYTKSTNKQAYTHATSYHPPETGKGIAIGEAKRYARTNTYISDFHKAIKQHILQMKVRGYNSKNIIDKILSVNHSDRSKPKRNNTNNRPVFVTRYTASASKVIKTIRHHWHHIQQDPTIGKFFKNYPIMAFKKNRNLKTHLYVRKSLQN